jgi:cation diffusion facilitator CzcD-associated flavoprotein CzcO
VAVRKALRDSGLTSDYRTVINANGHCVTLLAENIPASFRHRDSHGRISHGAGPFDRKSVLAVGIGNSTVSVDLCKRA